MEGKSTYESTYINIWHQSFKSYTHFGPLKMRLSLRFLKASSSITKIWCLDGRAILTRKVHRFSFKKIGIHTYIHIQLQNDAKLHSQTNSPLHFCFILIYTVESLFQNWLKLSYTYLFTVPSAYFFKL